ncbi:hypothetical protein ACROYT_G027554 [Oculina patagonica]
MELKEMILLFLSLVTLFQGLRAEQCDPKPMIIRHEGKKPCVYLDTKGIKTIGVGYNMQNADAPEVFKSIGADYNKFVNGPVTKWNVPCNCSSVPCLTEGQIEDLLGISLKTAIEDARKVIPTFDSLCCPVQNVMVDMSFTLGGPGFAQFTTFAKLVTLQYWKAAGDDLTVSLWCTKQAASRCMEDANIVREGCGCSQPYPQACDSQASTCCGSEAQQTCCKGTLTFKAKTFDEQLCCPFPKATCCEHNKCCSQQYTVCCPPPPAVPTYCCPADYPVCQDGKCYRARDGHVIEGKPAARAHVIEGKPVA